MTDSDFRIQGAVLNTVGLFTAVKDVRYYLNGIHFVTPAGRANVLRLQATDGHTAIRIDLDGWDGPEVDQTLSVPKLAVGGRYAFIPGAGGVTVPDRPEESVPARPATLATETEARHLELIDGRYPDLDRVIPAESSTPRAAPLLDARYVERAGKAVQALCKAFEVRYAGMRIQPDDKGGPALITVPSLPDVQIVIMPIRG